MKVKVIAYLEGEVDWKPADHIGTLTIHGNGIGRKFNIPVQDGLKVTSQTVADSTVLGRESQARPTHIVCI